MPKIDEVIRGDKIGRRANDYYIWVGCPICHKERWILKWKLTLSNFTGLCWACSARKNSNRSEATGISHPRWNGGQTTSRGYVYILNETHPARTSKGYVKRARLVLEEKLGRYLLLNCIPHHINGIKHDDRPSNLIELTKSQHTILHAFERRLVVRAKSLGIQEVVEWAVAERNTLKLLKAKQKLEKPTDNQTQAMLGAKMRTLQLLINKFRAKLKSWNITG